MSGHFGVRVPLKLSITEFSRPGGTSPVCLSSLPFPSLLLWCSELLQGSCSFFTRLGEDFPSCAQGMAGSFPKKSANPHGSISGSGNVVLLLSTGASRATAGGFGENGFVYVIPGINHGAPLHCVIFLAPKFSSEVLSRLLK